MRRLMRYRLKGIAGAYRPPTTSRLSPEPEEQHRPPTPNSRTLLSSGVFCVQISPKDLQASDLDQAQIGGAFSFGWQSPFFIHAPRKGGRRMRTMPEKNPDAWAALWVALSNPLWQGAIMAVLISFLRVLYDAKETDRKSVV
mgnify:CR=1 FL=1